MFNSRDNPKDYVQWNFKLLWSNFVFFLLQWNDMERLGINLLTEFGIY